MNIQIQSWSEKIASILLKIQFWSCTCSPLLLTPQWKKSLRSPSVQVGALGP